MSPLHHHLAETAPLPPDQHLETLLRSEVETLHDFISAWIRGDVGRSNALFDERLGGRLSADFFNIQPSGIVLTREGLTRSIFDAHGANPRFAIEVSRFQLLHVTPDCSRAAASYLECQSNARNTVPPDNDRQSIVFFDLRDAPQRITWQYLHELTA